MTSLSIQLLDVLICGLPNWKRNKRLFAMLTCFTDDSGSDKKGEVSVLSGYVAHADRWKEFSDDWDEALKSGPHPLQYFKMTEAAGGRGQFKGWGKPSCAEKIMEMAKIVRCYASFSVSAVLWWKDFEIVQKQYPHLPMGTYLLLFTNIMKAATFHIIDYWPQSEKIKFIFDEQEKIGKKAVALYERAKPLLPRTMVNRIAGVTHEDDKVFLPLQSADIAAWHHRRFCDVNAKYKKNYKKYELTECMKLLDEIPMAEPINLDARALKKFFERIESIAMARRRKTL